jgi:FKBP-type peptidyl-prolyl cis-trans isomerase
MKSIKYIIICLLIASFSFSCNKVGTKKIKTESDSVSYALGINIGTSLKGQFDDIDPYIIAQAIKDVYADKKDLMFDAQSSNDYLRKYFTKAQQAKAAKNLQKSNEFFEKNAKEEGVITTASGLQYKVLREGTGDIPKIDDKVKVHYTGMLLDGTVFDSSYDRNEPAVLTVNYVIPGWTEALQLMKVGSKYKLFIPPALGYGERGAGNKIGPNEAIIFEVELLEIVK